MEDTKKKPRRTRQPLPEVEEVQAKEPVVKKKARVKAHALNLRVGPSKNEKVLTILKQGQIVEVDPNFDSNIWSYVTADVEFGTVSGYVMTKFIK